VPEAIIELGETVGAALEVNLFNRTPERMQAIADHLVAHGATDLKGLSADARIPGLDHERATVDADGIHAADVVLVPLEDGDRAAALAEMGKTELVIDLNPASRSAQTAAVPIVDNIVRAVPNVTAHAADLHTADEETLLGLVDEFDADEALAAAEKRIRAGSFTD